MESPSYMTPLSQCWKLDCPPPNEAKGRKRVDMLKTQLQKFDHITKQHKVSTTYINTTVLECMLFSYTIVLQVKEKSKPSGGEAVKAEQSIVGTFEVSLSSYTDSPLSL